MNTLKDSKVEWTEPNEFKECFRVYQKWAYKKEIGGVFGERISRVLRQTRLGQEWESKILL